LTRPAHVGAIVVLDAQLIVHSAGVTWEQPASAMRAQSSWQADAT
jgi:hypothetical protein